MATWGLHIRIAEKVLLKNKDLDTESFLVGNIGPDCGVPNEDRSAFSPPTEISHWKTGINKRINPDEFFCKYLEREFYDNKEKSFLLGYYSHLLTDVEFSHFFMSKKENDVNYKKLEEDKSFIWTIKKDWYDLDRLYFRENPESLFYEVFQHINTFPDYLSYFPKGAILNKVKYIRNFYLKPSENLDREYIYLTLSEMNDFLANTVEKIEEEIITLLV